MTKMPWVRFFPSDWLGGTRGMSAVETGVYITLIATMYERAEPIPEEHSRLARLCGASNSAFKAALETLVDEGKIVRLDGGLWNERVAKEQVYLSEKSEVGSRAANARWGKKDKENNTPPDANAMPAQCQGNANQKPDTRIVNTSPSGDDATASGPVDYRDKLWRDGVASLIGQTGKTETSARSLVGKMLRDAKDNARLVLEKIEQAQVERIGDPVPWITQAVLKATSPPPRLMTVTDHIRADARKQGILDDTPGFSTELLETGDRARQDESAGFLDHLAIEADFRRGT